MREIKFRAKRKDNGEWVSGYFIEDTEFHGKPNHHSYIVDHKDPSGCFGSDIYKEVVSETVGQYTGLKDKNGIDIYEGDILFGFKKEVVAFFDGAFCKKDEKETVWHRMNGRDMGGYEVIGNIYDNPELWVEGKTDET